MKLKYVGQARPVSDAALKVTGKLKYTGDLHFPGMLHGKVLFSPIAHGKITKLDTSKAEELPGVKAVVSYLNAPKVIYNSALRFAEHDIPATEYIFDSTVRFVGDRVAAVAAETPEIAAQAVKLIKVEYEELPAVFDPEEALAATAPRIHPGGNAITELKKEAGQVDQVFANASADGAMIFESRTTTPMVHHLAIEPHTCIAYWSFDNKLSVWTTSQNVFATRILLGQIFNLPLNKVHIMKPPVGGGFGGKLEMVLEPVAALLAQKTGTYVRIELDRTETMVSTRTRHSAVIYLKSAVAKDGTFLAQEAKVITNTGAYATSALNVLGAMSGKFFSLYKTPNLRFVGIPVYTNSPIAGAMRGYGSPQIFAALEIHMDQIAKNLNISPIELRLKNLVQPYHISGLGNKSLGNCRIYDCVEQGAKVFNWQEGVKPNTETLRYGIGIACGVHGNGVYPAHHDLTTVTLKLNEDGSAVLFTGTHDIGQGTNTIYQQIIAEVLDINPQWITVVEADTEKTSFDIGVYASRNTWVGGNAVKGAAEKILIQLTGLAAEMLGTTPEQIYFDNGFFSIKETCSSNGGSNKVSISQAVIYSQKVKYQEVMASETYYSPCGAYSYGAHFARVQVNTETGQVKVLDYLAVHDVGRAINPLLVEGQIEGGIQMGIGYALCEELKLDPNTGKITNAHLKKYHSIKAKDMPSVKVVLIEKLEEPGPFGAKSIGEIATVPSAPAVVNAINNALGTSFTDLPVTPEKILKALGKKDT